MIMFFQALYIVTALQLPLGKTTVMHLVARERLPEPNNQGEKFMSILHRR